MHLPSRRQAVATLLAGAGLLLHRRGVRADHEYVAVLTNTQLGPDGEPGLVGTTLVVEERAAIPSTSKAVTGCIMPAYHVRVAQDGGRSPRLLMGIDATFHPDPPAPDPAQPGDRFVVSEDRQRGLRRWHQPALPPAHHSEFVASESCLQCPVSIGVRVSTTSVLSPLLLDTSDALFGPVTHASPQTDSGQ